MILKLFPLLRRLRKVKNFAASSVHSRFYLFFFSSLFSLRTLWTGGGVFSVCGSYFTLELTLIFSFSGKVRIAAHWLACLLFSLFPYA